jgi:hypothetical protein
MFIVKETKTNQSSIGATYRCGNKFSMHQFGMMHLHAAPMELKKLAEFATINISPLAGLGLVSLV